jgi:NADH-quinone oxidoreductase subunit M
MSAIGLTLVLVLGGLLAWLVGRRHAAAARWIALVALAIGAAWLLWLWWQGPAAKVGGSGAPGAATALGGPWLTEISLPWIPRFGIALHLGLDGLSLLFCLLAVLLGLMAVVASWREIQTRAGFFYLNILWVLAGTIGVFTALDLFVLFVFWELMLVPMAFVIGLWGHGDSRRAAIKFFLFTQGSGLLLLVGILILVLGHAAASGDLTFDAPALVGAAAGLDPRLAFWAMLGFFFAFAVKLPMVPLHAWLPDAHSLAPTGGSVLLAGVLLKTGGYALIRFLLPLFPDALALLTPVALALGVVGVVYGAVLAFAQTDIKRLIACSSISQMGYVLIGVFASAGIAGGAALDGAVLLMMAHGVTAAALFMIAGDLRERIHTLSSAEMGGLWGPLPRLSALGLMFAIATLGLPGFGNFAGEILVLIGTFGNHPVTALVALLGLVTSAIYALVLVQRVFHGPPAEPRLGCALHDLGLRESAALGTLALVALGLGLYPQPVLDLTALPLAVLAAQGVAP